MRSIIWGGPKLGGDFFLKTHLKSFLHKNKTRKINFAKGVPKLKGPKIKGGQN